MKDFIKDQKCAPRKGWLVLFHWNNEWHYQSKFLTKADAKKFIFGHMGFIQGNPMFIVKAEKYKCEATDLRYKANLNG